ncbi:hypothetical protein D3C77_156400 [compost metagenome]
MNSPANCILDSVTFTPKKPLYKGRHHLSVTMFPSRKNACRYMCGTTAEAKFCVHLEYLLSVSSYTVRPGTIEVASRNFKFDPDIVVTLCDGRTVYFQVDSYPAPAATPQARRIEQCKETLSGAGLIYQHTAPDFFGSPAITLNLELLYHYSHSGSLEKSNESVASLRKHFTGKATIQSLVDCGHSQADVTLALFNRQIKCNLNYPLRPCSPIWIDNENPSGNQDWRTLPVLWPTFPSDGSIRRSRATEIFTQR